MILTWRLAIPETPCFSQVLSHCCDCHSQALPVLSRIPWRLITLCHVGLEFVLCEEIADTKEQSGVQDVEKAQEIEYLMQMIMHLHGSFRHSSSRSFIVALEKR